MRSQDDERPAWVHILAASALLLSLALVYVLALRLTLDATRLDPTRTANDRDALYLGIHLAVLLAAAVGGYVAGQWLGGHGVAYATLLFGALGVLVVVILAGSQVLACDHDRNDIVRHWQCSVALNE